MGARLDCASPPLSGERELCRARSEDRALDPERSAEVSQRAFAGVEKTGVTHGPADSLRPANDLGIAPAALRTRKILASNTDTIWVSPAATATSPMPNMSSLRA